MVKDERKVDSQCWRLNRFA